MIIIPLQLQPGYKILTVTSKDDQEALKNFLPNQILRAKLTGVKKPRSLRQLGLYWACCRAVARNMEGKTEEDIDFDVKMELKHIKAFRIVKGVTIVEVDSISFVNLPHLEACNFFDRAFPVMAKMIGVTTEDLLKNADTEA